MAVDFGTIAWIAAVLISYRFGKAVGRFGRLRKMIIFLEWLKDEIDAGLRRTIGGEYQVHIHIADKALVCEDSTEASRLSVSLGEILSMVKPMEEAHPPRP